MSKTKLSVQNEANKTDRIRRSIGDSARFHSGWRLSQALLRWWCPPGMPLLVSPDLTLYRVDDESALSALAKAVGPLFPRYENMRQLLGFAPGPGGESGKTRENWSLLEEVTWVEQSSSGIYMPLVGTALHKLSLFNAQLGTSHALTSSFRKLLTGY